MAAPITPADQFLTTEQLAEETGISIHTWRHWGRTGTGPASIRLGRRRYWRRSVVDRWIAAQEARQQAIPA